MFRYVAIKRSKLGQVWPHKDIHTHVRANVHEGEGQLDYPLVVRFRIGQKDNVQKNSYQGVIQFYKLQNGKNGVGG